MRECEWRVGRLTLCPAGAADGCELLITYKDGEV